MPGTSAPAGGAAAAAGSARAARAAAAELARSARRVNIDIVFIPSAAKSARRAVTRKLRQNLAPRGMPGPLTNSWPLFGAGSCKSAVAAPLVHVLVWRDGRLARYWGADVPQRVARRRGPSPPCQSGQDQNVQRVLEPPTLVNVVVAAVLAGQPTSMSKTQPQLVCPAIPVA